MKFRATTALILSAAALAPAAPIPLDARASNIAVSPTKSPIRPCTNHVLHQQGKHQHRPDLSETAAAQIGKTFQATAFIGVACKEKGTSRSGEEGDAKKVYHTVQETSELVQNEELQARGVGDLIDVGGAISRALEDFQRSGSNLHVTVPTSSKGKEPAASIQKSSKRPPRVPRAQHTVAFKSPTAGKSKHSAGSSSTIAAPSASTGQRFAAAQGTSIARLPPLPPYSVPSPRLRPISSYNLLDAGDRAQLMQDRHLRALTDDPGYQTEYLNQYTQDIKNKQHMNLMLINQRLRQKGLPILVDANPSKPPGPSSSTLRALATKPRFTFISESSIAAIERHSRSRAASVSNQWKPTEQRQNIAIAQQSNHATAANAGAGTSSRPAVLPPSPAPVTHQPMLHATPPRSTSTAASQVWDPKAKSVLADIEKFLQSDKGY